MTNKIFVGNLDFGVTDQQLRELLSEVGEVVDVHIPTDRESGRPRGFAFVRFANEEQAAKAVETLNGQDVAGRALRLDLAEDRPRTPRGPGRDFGGGGRPSGGGRPGGGFQKAGKPKGSRRGLRAKKRS